MYCRACGKEMPDDVRFCGSCGAPVGPPARAADSPPVPPPPPVGLYPGGPAGPVGPGAPGAKGRRGLWIAVAAVAVVVIAAAVAVPLVLARGDGDKVTSIPTTTVTAPTTSTSATASTSTTVAETSSTSTTVSTKAGPPGDSSGEWVETDIPAAPAQVVAVAVSDDALLMQAQTDSGYRLYAYKFGSGETVELPVGAAELGGIDVDGFTAVWWEGTYDETSSTYVDQHIYSYDIVDGQKREVVGGNKNVGYPQIAGMWVTWTEGSPWDVNPEEYWSMPIYGSLLSLGTGGANEPTLLVPSAVASVIGDASWTYSLGENFLAWEQSAAVGGLDTGTYVVDLMTVPGEPRSIGAEAWRPSVSVDGLVYWQDGLEFLDLKTGEKHEIDPKGDFPTAAPTFAAYFRTVDTGDGSAYEIVARGLTGGYEQVLGQQADAPWLSPLIAASSKRVAFVAGDALHVFEWKGR